MYGRSRIHDEVISGAFLLPRPSPIAMKSALWREMSDSYILLSCLGSVAFTLPFVILFFLVQMPHAGPGTVLIAVLAVAFVLGGAAFGAGAVALIIFTGCFSIFAHCVYLVLPAL